MYTVCRTCLQSSLNSAMQSQKPPSPKQYFPPSITHQHIEIITVHTPFFPLYFSHYCKYLTFYFISAFVFPFTFWLIFSLTWHRSTYPPSTGPWFLVFTERRNKIATGVPGRTGRTSPPCWTERLGGRRTWRTPGSSRKIADPRGKNGKRKNLSHSDSNML